VSTLDSTSDPKFSNTPGGNNGMELLGDLHPVIFFQSICRCTRKSSSMGEIQMPDARTHPRGSSVTWDLSSKSC